MPAGRPSNYTEELAANICEMLARGTPLVKICELDEMPAYSTVRKWEKVNPEFAALSTRAKQDGTHYLADECLEIADEALPDDAEKARIEVPHRKLKIDTRMRLIGKWNAREYGEKVTAEHTGPNGGEIVHTVRHEVIDPKSAG
jgi:hypothetical protein